MNKQLSLCLALGSLAAPLSAQQLEFGAYWPLDTGYTWTYTNISDPLDTFSETVVGMTSFAGQSAWELQDGSPESVFFGNDGVTFTVYGFEENGIIDDIPDVVIGAFTDGDAFMLGTDGLIVMRDWSELDHNLTGPYGVNPDLCDIVLLIGYHLSWLPGPQNTVLESGITAQPFGIEFVEWFQLGVGPIANQDFNQDGSLDGSRYDTEASFVIGRNYCTSLPNSASPVGYACGAIISASGSMSVSANNLVLSSEPAPPGEPGIFYYGPLALAGVPFGDGLRCVGGAGGTVVRVFPFATANAGGVLSASIDNTLPAHAQFAAGSTLNFQSWFRDPAAAMAGFNLSNGLAITFTP